MTLDYSGAGVGGDDTAAPPPSAAFAARRGPLFRLVLKNAILTFLTLGIYRFWAKTNVRRFFWSRTRILNSPLEYTGTPGELFLGFLIAVAVLVPFFALYELAYALLGEATLVQTFWVDLVYALSIALLIQAAFYRMWRYRLTRTTWRGIRLGLDGSTWTYVGLSIVYWGANILCLGLLTPWVRTKLWRYRTVNSRFGETHFSFDGPIKPLIVPWLVTYFAPVILFTFALWGNLETIGDFYGRTLSGQMEGSQEIELPITTPGAELALIVLVVGAPLLFVWYRIREFRHFINHTVLGQTRFTSDLRVGSILGVLALAWLALIVFLFLFFIVVSGVIAATMQLAADPTAGGAVFGLVSVFVVIAFVVFFAVISPLISIVIVRFALVRNFCDTFEIDGKAHLDGIVQSSAMVPARGEGLADAFDVGAI